MIQVPLHQLGQKIGESGKIDWFQRGKFVEFTFSSWMPNKFHIKTKVQEELLSIRNWCGLSKTYIKLRISQLVMFIALLAYIIFIVLLDPIDQNGDIDPNYMNNVWTGYFVFFVLIVIISVFQIISIKKAENLIKTSIQAYNVRLDQERVGVFLALKEDTGCKKHFSQLWNRMNYVEVFEYVNY